MAARLRAVPGEEALAAAGRAAAALAELPVLATCERIVLYASLPDELPSRPLYELARSRRKPMLWPRLAGHPPAGERLAFAACDAWEGLVPGRFGVPGPAPDAPEAALGAGDLLLVPGRAFDRAGRRLGRGGGHYDRVLAQGPFALTVGVAYGFQRVERVPTEPHDRPVDAVLFEGQLIPSTPRQEEP